MKLKLLALLAMFGTSDAFAKQYGYHPGSPLYIGGGFNPSLPSQSFQSCLDYQGVLPIDASSPGAAVETRANIRLIKSQKELFELVDYSAQIQGSYGMYSGGAAASLVDERAFHSDSLTWIMLFKTDYGRFRVNKESIKPAFARLNADEFLQKCGSEFVVSQRLGVMTYAIMTVKNLSQSRKREFEAKLNLDASGALWDASMDTNYKEVLRSAMASTDFSLDIRAYGGRGITDLTGLLGDAKDFVSYSKVPEVMKSYIANQRLENAVPLQYSTSDAAGYQSNIPANAGAFNRIQFENIFYSYDNFSSIENRIENILYGADSQLYSLSQAQGTQLTSQLNQFTSDRDQLYRAGRACFDEAGQCAAPAASYSFIEWPRLKRVAQACENNRRSALDNGLVPIQFYEMAKSRDLVFLIENGQVVGQAKCDEVYF